MKEKVVKIVLKLVWFKKSFFWFEILAITQDQPIFLLLNLCLLLYFPKQIILSKKEFCVGSDVYFIWCILTFDNQAFFDQVMKTRECVPRAAYHPPFQVGYHLKHLYGLVDQINPSFKEAEK